MERQWDDLRIFLEVTRAKYIPAAARALALSDATVRRRLAALESQLGVSLFDRVEGMLKPTRAGMQLLPVVEDMERKSQEAIERLQNADHRIEGLVRLGAPDGISTLLLAPRLARFQSTHPDLDVEMVNLTHSVDLRRREADIAVVWDRPHRGEHRISALRPVTMRLYASQSYLEEHAPIGRIEDLKLHRFVGYPLSSPIAQSLAKMLSEFEQNVRLVFTSPNILAQAAVATEGGGIIMLPRYVADQRPALREILPETFSVSLQLWLLIHKEVARLARIQSVAAMVRSCFP
ncbi:MAG: LysR family transcriptional regulator [Sphingobium sp.]|uniref:LysR family transcriptional regulator n=1 Tax=Sphingobium sp. TaxID=1912891 RepID=UPI000DB51C82|nr:LysR family transcriptional regulator [Sphingobium sp.]PZU07611.1 MAG: LysR family transcriptional regulator [Sphingobium sp.]